MKRTLKTIIRTLLMLIICACLGFSIYVSVYIDEKGVEFSEKNIDDVYGKLDNNTKLVLEDTLKTNSQEKNVELFFSFVYEDLNQNYIQELSSNDEAIFIYYNDTTKELKAVTNLKLKENFQESLTSNDDLAASIPKYVNSICNNIEDSTNRIYIQSKMDKYFFAMLSFMVILVILIISLISYIKYIQEYLEYLKLKKAVKQDAKKAKHILQKETSSNKEKTNTDKANTNKTK